MLQQLEKNEYSKALPLFHRLAQVQPMCAAVLAGVYPGKVFVDDRQQPRTALLTTFLSSETGSAWGFLAGEAMNRETNQDLNAAIFQRQAIHPESPAVLLTCDPPEWDAPGCDAQISAVLAPRVVIRTPRRSYTATRLEYDWRAALPQGFVVQRLDQGLRQLEGLELPEEVRETLDKWLGAGGENFRDFGFVIIDERGEKPAIACWATVDFVTQDQTGQGAVGDIGFFTQPEYRRQGLGTITAAAALEYGLAHGLSQVTWTCMESNQGSICIAEKLGLQRAGDYPMFVLFLDEADHLATAGYNALSGQEYALACEYYQQALALKDEHPGYIYYEAAQTLAMTGQPQEALHCLAEGVKRGEKNASDARQRKEFESLHSLPEWEAILNEMAEAAV